MNYSETDTNEEIPSPTPIVKFKTLKNIGKIHVNGTSFVISDPIFGKLANKEKFSLNVRVGSLENEGWKAMVVYDKETTKVKELIVHRDDLRKSDAEWVRMKKIIPCDSGRMGIFLLNKYPRCPGHIDDTWSDAARACYVANNDSQCGILDEYGVVCKSGFGPGYFSYDVWKYENKVVGVKVNFITPENKAKYERERG